MGRFWLFAVAMLFAAAGAIAVLILRPGPAPAPANNAIGATIAVDPAATIAAKAGGTVVAQLTSPVHVDDLLATGPDGAIRVQFTDATFFSLGANASARVDSYVFDPEHDSSGVSMDVRRGAFRFVSGKSLHPAPGKPVVTTPVAAIGVRGTGFDVVIGPEAEALFRRIDPRFVPDGGDTSTATLILLTEGAIDVDGSGQKIALEIPGQVLFFRRRGEPPIGPLMAWSAVRGDIGALASPASLGAEPGRGDPGAPPPPPVASPSAAPSPRPSVSPSPSPTVAPPRPSPSPTLRPTPSPSSRVTPKPTPTPSPRFTPRPTPTPRFTPTPTPRFTPRPTPTSRFTPRPTPTPRFTPRPTPTARFTPKPTPTATPRPRPTRAPLTNVPRTAAPRPSPTPVKR